MIPPLSALQAFEAIARRKSFSLAATELHLTPSAVSHQVAKLEGLLEREGRRALADACFDFLPARGQLDVLGWEAPDIFAH